jgi:hypothetical protein
VAKVAAGITQESEQQSKTFRNASVLKSKEE